MITELCTNGGTVSHSLLEVELPERNHRTQVLRDTLRCEQEVTLGVSRGRSDPPSVGVHQHQARRLKQAIVKIKLVIISHGRYRKEETGKGGGRLSEKGGRVGKEV